MVWLPFAAVLSSPFPVTATDVAWAEDQEMTVEAGAVPVDGLALTDAVTAGGALIVTVCEIVPDFAPALSVAWAV